MPASSSTLQEDFSLMRDAALADPVVIPWMLLGWIAVAMLVAVLVWMRVRRRIPLKAVSGPPELLEDTLAALEVVWSRATEVELTASITELAEIMRRYLARRLAKDCTTATTAELDRMFDGIEVPPPFVREELRRLGARFFNVADMVRFAGEAATLKTVRDLFDVACAFVRATQQSAEDGTGNMPPRSGLQSRTDVQPAAGTGPDGYRQTALRSHAP